MLAGGVDIKKLSSTWGTVLLGSPWPRTRTWWSRRTCRPGRRSKLLSRPRALPPRWTRRGHTGD